MVKKKAIEFVYSFTLIYHPQLFTIRFFMHLPMFNKLFVICVVEDIVPMATYLLSVRSSNSVGS